MRWFWFWLCRRYRWFRHRLRFWQFRGLYRFWHRFRGRRCRWLRFRLTGRFRLWGRRGLWGGRMATLINPHQFFPIFLRCFGCIGLHRNIPPFPDDPNGCKHCCRAWLPMPYYPLFICTPQKNMMFSKKNKIKRKSHENGSLYGNFS